MINSIKYILMITKKNQPVIVLLFTILLLSFCKKKSGETPPPPPPPAATNDVEVWLTKADQSVLLQKQSGTISFTTTTNSYISIAVDSAQRFQTIDGFGYTLTGGSAGLLKQLNANSRASLLQDFFGNGSNAIGVSYLRVSMGASDLSASVFSYNDLPTGQTDVNLNNFSLSKDTLDVIPMLKEILGINPNIKIMGSPWSPPVWMKDNGSSIGGSLLPQYYSVYAKYFVKYIQQMKANGITIDAVTIQNEPQYGGNNPSMLMSAAQQTDFIKNHLGPAFQTAAITTKIIIWDHNCDNAAYPVTVLNDAGAKQFIDGAAFHLYAGNVNAMSSVHDAHPDKNLYFTEQWTGANGSFDGDFKWHIKNVIIGTMRNWSKVALEWNLAANRLYEPHTIGGCTECKGALTIDGSFIAKNVAYYIIAQISKFVPPGAVRISSIDAGTLSSAAFTRPDGKKVLVVLNDDNASITFNIRYKNRWAPVTLPANSAATYIW
jgi:glucosylceramidase